MFVVVICQTSLFKAKFQYGPILHHEVLLDETVPGTHGTPYWGAPPKTPYPQGLFSPPLGMLKWCKPADSWCTDVPYVWTNHHTLHHPWFFLCWESTYPEVGAQKSPSKQFKKSLVLSSCSAGTQKRATSSNNCKNYGKVPPVQKCLWLRPGGTNSFSTLG